MPEFRPYGSKNVCDFCSSDNPAWRYPAKNFRDEDIPDISESIGDWAACNTCANLINTNQWTKLAARCFEMCGTREDNPVHAREVRGAFDQMGRDRAMNKIMALHRQFRKARTGPAVRIEAETRAQ